MSALERGSFYSTISEGLRQLPEREQIILALYYGQELSHKEIGGVLGLREPRVRDLHVGALRRLWPQGAPAKRPVARCAVGGR